MNELKFLTFPYKPLDMPRACQAERHGEFQNMYASHVAMLYEASKGHIMTVREYWLVCPECRDMMQKSVELDAYREDAT